MKMQTHNTCQGFYSMAAAHKKVKTTKSSTKITINVTFMGYENVGKSSIIQRILGNKVSTNSVYKPTVFEFYNYEFQLEGNSSKQVCLNISDTAGAFSFPAMDRLAMQKSNVIVLVFDLSCPRSFHHINRLASEIELEAPKAAIIVVGNKSDLKSYTDDVDEIEDYVICTMNHAYLEMSATHDENADKLLKRIYEEYEIAIGPYSVRKGKRNTISRMKSKLTKSYHHLLDSFDI